MMVGSPASVWAVTLFLLSVIVVSAAVAGFVNSTVNNRRHWASTSGPQSEPVGTLRHVHGRHSTVVWWLARGTR